MLRFEHVLKQCRISSKHRNFYKLKQCCFTSNVQSLLNIKMFTCQLRIMTINEDSTLQCACQLRIMATNKDSIGQ